MKKISPHVQIYKFPITAISSITNRITGLGMTGMYIGLGASCLMDQNIMKKYDESSQMVKTSVNYMVLFPSIYHSYGGLRHFIWDKYPQYITNQLVRKSSIALFGFSVLSTIISEKYILHSNIRTIL